MNKFDKKKEYNNYIHSDKWKLIRKNRLEMDNYHCQYCLKNNKNIRAREVHHLTYKNFQNEKMEDLISLCRECHKKIHKNG